MSPLAPRQHRRLVTGAALLGIAAGTLVVTLGGTPGIVVLLTCGSALGVVAAVLPLGSSRHPARVSAVPPPDATSDASREVRRLLAVERLAGGIAHDFNNVLTAVVAFTDLLESADARAPYVTEIRAAGERGERLAAQLMSITRGRALPPAFQHLEPLVRRMEAELRPLLGRGIELEVRTPAACLPPVLVEPGQVEEILRHLVSNAAEAMPSGGRLRIEIAEVTAGTAARPAAAAVRTQVRLTVEDTGRGMSPELLDRAFEPLFTTKTGVRGAGLGLSAVQTIARQCRAQVGASSEPGKGARFWIDFPSAQERPEGVYITAGLRRELEGSTEERATLSKMEC